MRGWLGLGGGDEFGRSCERGDRALLAELGGPVSIAVVPTAQADGGSDPVRAGGNGVRYFQRLGATAENVLITDRASAADPELLAPLRSANLIYLIGGNPGYLLHTLRDTPAMSTIIAAWNSGTTVVGSSAGAMILCGAQLGRPSGAEEPWIAGIGLVPNVLAAVHHERTADKQGQNILATLPPGYQIIGIDACNLAVWRPDGDWQMFGDGRVRVYGPGREELQSYRHGQRWSMTETS